MRLCGLWIVLAGCGRIGFDDGTVATDSTVDGLTGHDEDGDGVPDAFDTCPAKAGPQTDSDGDGVGDLCDWEPANPRQHVVLFATMQPGDQPLDLDGSTNDQLPDAIRFTAPSGTMAYVHTFGDVSIELGADIEAIQGATKQHQVAMDATNATLPDNFFEVNEVPGSFQEASISQYDGNAFSSLQNAFLTNGVHPGSLTLTSVQTIGGTDILDVSLDAERYHLEHPGSTYDGGTRIFANVNNLTISIRYVFVVAGG